MSAFWKWCPMCGGKYGITDCEHCGYEPPTEAQAQGGGDDVEPTPGDLRPCPFCGAPAERIEFGPGDAENEGGSCIACTRCQSSGPVEFGRKENFVSNWNRRTAPPSAPSPQQISDYLLGLDTIEREVVDLAARKLNPSAPVGPHTYAGTQATKCAGCGEHKHTPLRIDAMGGYVCLTCIDQKLGSLLGEFGYASSAPVGVDRIGQAISDHLCALAESDGTLTLDPFDSENIDAIVAAMLPALAQQPAAVDLDQFWESVMFWRAQSNHHYPWAKAKAKANENEADRLIELIESHRLNDGASHE